MNSSGSLLYPNNVSPQQYFKAIFWRPWFWFLVPFPFLHFHLLNSHLCYTYQWFYWKTFLKDRFISVRMGKCVCNIIFVILEVKRHLCMGSIFFLVEKGKKKRTLLLVVIRCCSRMACLVLKQQKKSHFSNTSSAAHRSWSVCVKRNK